MSSGVCHGRAIQYNYSIRIRKKVMLASATETNSSYSSFEYHNVVFVSGVGGSGKCHGQLALAADVTYYTTVRALTGAGNVLEATSDGFQVDVTAPTVSIGSVANTQMNDSAVESTLPLSELYQDDPYSFTASWDVQDTDSGTREVWFSVGTYPGEVERVCCHFVINPIW